LPIVKYEEPPHTQSIKLVDPLDHTLGFVDDAIIERVLQSVVPGFSGEILQVVGTM
jgi:hypothetical protein